MATEERKTRPVNFINFHGLHLLVVEHADIQYIEAKPLCDLAGMDWRGARRALQEGDNAVLYGSARLEAPKIAGLGGLKSPPDGLLYIRLDRARMFLARISTERMRANGNQAGAEQLLALQTEWAHALHAYETHGVAAKAGRSNGLKDLHQLARTRALLSDPRERAAFTLLLHQELATVGLPLDTFDDPQGHLPLATATTA